MAGRQSTWIGQTLQGILLSLPVLPLNVAIGALLLLAVARAARRPARPHSDDRRLLAWALVGVLPLVVAVHILMRLPLAVDEAMFVTGALAFAAGAFLLLGRDDAGWDRRGPDDSEPPWWPDFERGLHEYSTRRAPRPDRVTVR
jgi:hypothetical protein